jgi:hypothetical protein
MPPKGYLSPSSSSPYWQSCHQRYKRTAWVRGHCSRRSSRRKPHRLGIPMHLQDARDNKLTAEEWYRDTSSTRDNAWARAHALPIG